MNTNDRMPLSNGEKLLRVLVFTLILSVMNATMFNVALPQIGQEFSLSPSQVSWIVTAYIIVYAIGSATYGKLADKYKLKDLITIGLILFACGSVLGLAASQYWMVVAGRVLQAIGASVIPATSAIIPVRYFPQERRGRALGVISSGLALGAAIGPVVSGFATSFADWRLLFGLSILSLFTLPYYRRYLDDAPGAVGRTDLLGGLLLAGSVATLLLAVTRADWLWAAAGVVVLLLFIVRINTAAEPFIQPSLFRNSSYSSGILIMFLVAGISFGIPYLIPQLLSNVNGMSPAVIGFVLCPGAIAAALLGRTGGRIADSRGSVSLAYMALALQFLSFGLLSIVVGLSPVLIAACLIFGNLGQTFNQIAMTNLISRTLTKDQTGVGMGLMMMMNFIAGAAATTVISKTLDTSGSGRVWNPLASVGEAAAYSNIFLILTALIAFVACAVIWQYGRRPATIIIADTSHNKS